jgi:hypothetical protein
VEEEAEAAVIQAAQAAAESLFYDGILYKLK